ncbi:MAG: 50S ribosomal protein L1 [bacterium]
MAKRGKKYLEKSKLIEPGKRYILNDAISLVKKTSLSKFDGTVDLSIKLNIDPKRSDQQVRGVVSLPGGTGKNIRVVVIAKGEKIKEAESAGADFAGGDDLIEKISKGWADFDVTIATPDVMSAVGKLGKVLGQKGLMPNPKTGTVTFDVGRVVKEFKAGKIEYKTDKTGVIHAPLGKISFSEEKISSNLSAVLDAVSKSKPSGVKGTLIKSITLSATMGPAVKVDASKLLGQINN